MKFICGSNHNQAIMSNERRKFTILHELGHILLGHDFEAEPGTIIGDNQEIEANFFAAQIQMPDALIYELIDRGKKITVENLVLWFGVSKEAAQKRIETLQKFDRSYKSPDEKELDHLITMKFAPFLHSIAPKSREYFINDDEEELERERWNWR